METPVERESLASGRSVAAIERESSGLAGRRREVPHDTAFESTTKMGVGTWLARRVASVRIQASYQADKPRRGDAE